MTKTKLKMYLYNAISMLEEADINLHDDLWTELGMTKEEYDEVMADDSEYEVPDLILDYDAYELNLATGNIEVCKDIFDAFVPNTYINIQFIDDGVEDRIAQYKMIAEDDEKIYMEYIGG